MRRQRLARSALAAAIVLILAILGCALQPPTAPPATNFYVSVKGSDSAGDGSQGKPWRHIQYAIDNAKPAAGTTLTIHLFKGIYEENPVIKRGLEIVGAGVGIASTYPNDPLLPVQEVSVIVRDLANDAPGILIQDATSVNLQNLVVLFGGLRAVNTRLTLYNVEVQRSRGLYGVQIEDCFVFYLEKVKITTEFNVASDYGLDVIASDGDVLNSYLGDDFDHVVNLSPIGPNDKIDPNVPYQAHSVSIRDSEIAGSKIYYADGVRILGAMNVRISNTTIKRAHPDNEPASTGAPHNLPYAGVEIDGYLTKANIEGKGVPSVELDGVTTSGFDVGIGMAVESTNVLVKNSSLSAVTHDVETSYVGYTNTIYPHVDFGGGSLSSGFGVPDLSNGSVGNNSFDTNSPYAFYHNAPYGVTACHNTWGVANNAIDSQRIYDHLDNASLGRVTWDCG
jgi:hypothetical protein